jgi:pyroglutamyl-peptidase
MALPVEISDNAGDYICNLLFYRLMSHRADHGTPRLAGFVHVPFLDEQLPSLSRAGLPTADLRTITKAQLLTGMQTIVEVVAQALVAETAGECGNVTS